VTILRKTASSEASAHGLSQNCTKSGHQSVDELHSIDCKADKAARFYLTPKIDGVKTNSFFDTFWSFPGWCSVRGSSEITLSNREVRREGQQGSIAKCWSRRTGKLLKAR